MVLNYFNLVVEGADCGLAIKHLDSSVEEFKDPNGVTG